MALKMKKINLLILVTTLCIACNNSEKKQAIKIGAVQASENNLKSEKEQSPLQASIERGGLVYSNLCMQCHLANGKGVPGNFPPLAGSNWLKEKRTESIYTVKYGQKGEIEVNGVQYNGVMMRMGLSDEEVADVMNYVMNNWGNSQKKMVTAAEVANIEE